MPLSDFLRNRGGSISLSTALLVPTLIMSVAGAVEFQQHMAAIKTAQRAVDSAALAAVQLRAPNTDADRTELAKRVASANMPEMFKLSDIGTEMTDSILTASAKVSTKFVFGSLIGLDTLETDLVARAALEEGTEEGEGDHDVMLALDTTYSMRYSDVIALKNASKALTDYLLDSYTTDKSAKVRLGLVPFARYVNVGAERDSLSWVDYVNATNPDNVEWKGCIHAYYDNRDGNLALDQSTLIEAGYDYSGVGYDSAKCLVAPIVPLSNDAAAVKAKIGAMTAGGSTYIPNGLIWSRRMLEPQNPLQNHAENPDAKPTLVLFSDGGNAVNWVRENLETDRHTKEICESIKADGIRIIIIAFSLDQTVDDNRRAKDVLESCATSPDLIFAAEDRTELFAVFELVGKAITSKGNGEVIARIVE